MIINSNKNMKKIIKLKPLDAVAVAYRIMTISGVWPKENPSMLYKINTSITWFFGLTVFATMALEAFFDLNDFAKLSETLYILATYAAYLIKLGVFTYHQKTFMDLMNFLGNPIFNSYPDDFNHYMKNSIKTATFLAKIYQYGIVCVVGLYAIYPILDHVPLPFPFPYDLGKYRYFMFAFQLIGEASAACGNSAIDLLFFALMSVAIAQLNIVAEKIIHFKQKCNISIEENEELYKNDEISVKYLKECVEHHLAVVKFIESIENIFNVAFLAQFLASAVIICNTLFYFVLVPLSLKFALLLDYLFLAFVQLFMYSWYGNEIMLKSLKIGEACYMSDWQLCNNRIRKSLFIIMERSKKPLTITALKFSAINLATLLAIIRWSYSALTLLLRMYNERPND